MVHIPAEIEIVQWMPLEEARRRYPDRFRQDCPFPGCQLSAGHPPLHCVNPSQADGSSAEYWMMDDDGRVLRRV